MLRGTAIAMTGRRETYLKYTRALHSDTLATVVGDTAFGSMGRMYRQQSGRGFNAYHLSEHVALVADESKRNSSP